MHKAIYLFAILILHLRLKDHPLCPIFFSFFSEVIHIIHLILTARKLVFAPPCEVKGKILVTLQGDTDEELTFCSLNLPLLDS